MLIVDEVVCSWRSFFQGVCVLERIDFVCWYLDCKSWARVAWSRGNHRKGDCWLHGDGTHKIWAENINSGRKGGMFV